jgi:hypothetical protein
MFSNSVGYHHNMKVVWGPEQDLAGLAGFVANCDDAVYRDWYLEKYEQTPDAVSARRYLAGKLIAVLRAMEETSISQDGDEDEVFPSQMAA